MTTFTDLALADPLSRALSTLGYDTPTPIQAQAIPHLLDGRDLLGIAQTGTGKTAAFALPALHHVFTRDIDPPKRGARVLVLAPTRELVGQIYDSFVSYGRFMMDLSAAKITGGVSINNQIKKLVRGNDVLVATPGRLIDLLDRKAISLSDVEVLILDEADQMMDMGFIHALKTIVPLLPEDRQTVMLSATLPPKIKTLAKQFLSDPVRVSVTPPNSTAEKVEQSLIHAKPAEKPMLLADRLLQPDVEKALVFTRTKHGADRVVKRLMKAGLPALAIHGNKSQGQRQRALDAFRTGVVDILVATDVAARGIDIPGITHVFNYEIPNVPEQYVHRIGRTARADASGRAIAFVAPDEKAYLKDIQKLLGDTIPVDPMPDDMDARIEAVRKRKAAEPINLSPDQSRKGRGKSGKKKKSRKPEARKSGRTRGEEPLAGDGDAEYRRRRTQKSKGMPKPDTKSTSGPEGGTGKPRRKKAPKRKRPAADATAASDRKAARPTRRKRRAPGRNDGGQQPPRRRKP